MGEVEGADRFRYEVVLLGLNLRVLRLEGETDEQLLEAVRAQVAREVSRFHTILDTHIELGV